MSWQMTISDFHSMVRINTEKQAKKNIMICKLIKILLASVVNFNLFGGREEVQLRPSTFIIIDSFSEYMILYFEFRSKGQSSASIFNTLTAICS